MKFTAPQSALLDALTSAAAVADAKWTMPILAHVLLRVEGKRLTVAATDLTMSYVDAMSVTGGQDGSIALPAKIARDLIANHKGDVTVKTDGAWADIKSGRTTMRLASMSSRDFPSLPEPPQTFAAVSAPEVVRILSACLPSVAHDETRLHLNAVQLLGQGKAMRAASTDGHRLTVTTADLSLPASAERGGLIGNDLSMLVPRAGAARLFAMAKGLATLELARSGPYLFARSNDHLLAVKLVDAQYPPIEQVIPKHTNRLSVDRAELLASVKRCALMSSESRGLSIAIGHDCLTLSSSDPDRGDVREELDATCEAGPTIGVNPKYLIDALGAMATDRVSVDYGAALDPILVADGAATFAVVMPMRI